MSGKDPALQYFKHKEDCKLRDPQHYDDGCTCGAWDKQPPGPVLVAMSRIQQEVLMDVVEERSRQDEKWGGEGHDDKHSVRDWVTYIMAYLGRIVSRENKWGADSKLARKLFIQVAALAVAAVEALDRRR